MRLNVYVIVCVEDFSPKVAAILFQSIYVNSTAIISTLVTGISYCRSLWVSLSIFPGKAASACSHYSLGAVVLRCDELYVVLLSQILFFNELCNMWRDLFDLFNDHLVIVAVVITVSVKHFRSIPFVNI